MPRLILTLTLTFWPHGQWMPKAYHGLHCVWKKNDTDVAHYNFKAHQPILVIFGMLSNSDLLTHLS